MSSQDITDEEFDRIVAEGQAERARHRAMEASSETDREAVGPLETAGLHGAPLKAALDSHADRPDPVEVVLDEHSLPDLVDLQILVAFAVHRTRAGARTDFMGRAEGFAAYVDAFGLEAILGRSAGR